MYVMAVNHDVEDYDRWKAEFDAFPKAEMGALFHRLNRNTENPNNLTVVHGFESAEAARAFVDRAELKEAMQRAGVVGMPRIEIFEEVEAVQY